MIYYNERWLKLAGEKGFDLLCGQDKWICVFKKIQTFLSIKDYNCDDKKM